jgi:hypothetical protein
LTATGRGRRPASIQALDAAADFAQHPFSYRHDESRVLEHGNEFRRRNELPVPVPAQQRLEPADRPGIEPHLGLKMQMEFAALQRAAQAGLELQALEQPVVHLRQVKPVAGAALLLGAVHRRIRVLGQGLRVGAVGRKEGDAYAGGDESMVALEVESLSQHVDHFLRNYQQQARPSTD